MYKKAGIIVGILMIIVAIVIYIIAKNAMGSGDTGESTASSVESTTIAVVETPTPVTAEPVVAPQTTAAVTQSTPAPVESTQAPMQSTQAPMQSTQAPMQSDIPLVEINGATLPEFVDESDMGTVVGRHIYSRNGQVLFSLMINTTTHGQIEYFTTLKNYNLTDGTKLSVELRTYKAQSGTFPSIISVSLLS